MSPAEHTSEDLTVGPESASSSRPAQAEPTTVACTASIINSDAQICARSTTPIPVHFDALSADPREGGCGHVKNNILSVMSQTVDEQFVSRHTTMSTGSSTCASNPVQISAVHVSNHKQCAISVPTTKIQ